MPTVAAKTKSVNGNGKNPVSTISAARLDLDALLAAFYAPDPTDDETILHNLGHTKGNIISEYEPTRVLARAILEDAISILFGNYTTSMIRIYQWDKQAEMEWLLVDDNDEYVFSFNNVCAMLGLDASYMRRKLTKMWERRQQIRGGLGNIRKVRYRRNGKGRT